MAIQVTIDHAVFDSDDATANLQHIALSYEDDVELKRGRVFIKRDGSNRLKGQETSNFLAQLNIDRPAFVEKLRNQLTLPTPVRIERTRDVNGLVTSVVEYY